MARARPSAGEVWRRIVALEGERFETKTGLEFVFTVRGETLTPSRTRCVLSLREFEQALALVPLSGPGEINRLVRGPAYVWAVLHDRRVRGADW